MSRRFTLEEAESLLPEVEKSLREAISFKSEFEQAESALQAINQRVIMLGGVMVDRAAVYQHRLHRDQNVEQLKAAMQKIQEVGCVVKDLDIGLVDFPTSFHGEEVYLCWKLGEAGIGFWHGTDEGFAGRKPIDADFREHHRGDAAN
jgi:hypothetical protein